MNEEIKKAIEAISEESIKVFTPEEILRHAQEEAGEFVAAVNHYLRTDREREGWGLELCEEFVDLSILLAKVGRLLCSDFNPGIMSMFRRKIEKSKQVAARRFEVQEKSEGLG